MGSYEHYSHPSSEFRDDCEGCLDEVKPTVETIKITPNYENTAAFFATALRDHSFDRGATEPIVSLIEQVRYLTQTDIDAVQRLIDRLNRGGR